MRIAIVDDSRLARLELQQQLQAIGGLELVGEAVDVASAVQLLNTHAVDLVLLDIDLPDGTGFDVLEKVNSVPLVIFVTAFNDYAIRSFEVNALDYLLKPVRQQRLQLALDKAQQQLAARRQPVSQRIFIKDGDQCFFVDIKDIRAFEAMGNYTRVHLEQAVPAIYKPISSVAERLDQSLFFRASRSWIINTRFITAITPNMSGGFRVTLCNRLQVTISKRQASAFRKAWTL